MSVWSPDIARSNKKMTTSAEQIAANILNAQHSTGPRTDEGKKRSSLNGMRHGLTGQIHITTDAERAALESFTKGIVDSLAPSDPLESQIAQTIAEDYWRLNRGRAIENNILALGYLGEDGNIITEHDQNHTALAAARTFMENPNAFRLISLYAQRTNRDIQKNITLLKQLQAEKEAQRKAEIEEAAFLMKQRLAEGLPYDDLADRHSGIKGNGFVFSLHQITSFADRQNRLKTFQPAQKPMLKRAA
jgi:hypothetical protein